MGKRIRRSPGERRLRNESGFVLAGGLSGISFARRAQLARRGKANSFCHAFHVETGLTEQSLSKRHA